jgi:hypothetical protein
VEEGDRIVSWGSAFDSSSAAVILRPVRLLSDEALAQAELEMDNKDKLDLSREDDGMVYSYRLIRSARTIDLFRSASHRPGLKQCTDIDRSG